MVDYIIDNYVEIVGALFALAYLWLEYKENRWLWPVGIVASLFYVYIFYVAKFYADMGLQFYYIAVSVYGWIYWKRSNGTSRNISSATTKELALYSAVGILISLGLYLFLHKYTDSPVPSGDAFTSGMSIVATFMLSRKILQQWLFWIVVNAVSCALYIYKGLNVTFVLYLVFTLVSIAGYIKWRKQFNTILQ